MFYVLEVLIGVPKLEFSRYRRLSDQQIRERNVKPTAPQGITEPRGFKPYLRSDRDLL